MAGASSDGEVNHWPAFVDVLTTVIMVVTFLLVILSAAVMALSQKVVENIKEQMAQQYEAPGKDKDRADASSDGASAQKRDGAAQTDSPVADDGSSVAELGDMLRTEKPIDGQEKLTIRTRETADTLKLQVKAMERPDEANGIRVTTADVLLKLGFEPLAVTMNDETTTQINGFIKGKMQPGMKYEIWSFAPQTASVSEAERLAFYRAALVRNLLVRAGIPPASILTQVRVTDPMSKDGHNVRVVLKP